MFRPLARSPVRTSEAVEREASWITEQICSSYLDIADFIEMAVAEYSTLYGQTAESLIPITIRKDITNELHDLQTRPPMLGRYRRYVVIGHKSDQLAYRGAGWVCYLSTTRNCLLTRRSSNSILWQHLKVVTITHTLSLCNRMVLGK
jgi:hypothetical protein